MNTPTCHICYEQQDDGRMVYLQCTHSLCDICLTRLHQRACPFCRSVISEDILPKRRSVNSIIPTDYENIYGGTLRIRVRRRRRHHRTTSEIEDNIIVETKKIHGRGTKRRRENRRKAKWATRNARTRAFTR
uniref:RING-type domain-containing protein n=1 Tax=viral metagenome TaxID=1070528 RepID=A0A6C0EK28_9ZZZZ